MSKYLYWSLLLLFACPLSSRAGQGTIRETDTGIYVEYSCSDDPEIKAVISAKIEQEKQVEIETEKLKIKAEQSNARIESTWTPEKVKESEERRAKRHMDEGD